MAIINDHNHHLKSLAGGGDPDEAKIMADLERSLKAQGRHIDQLIEPAPRSVGTNVPPRTAFAAKLKL
jgi:hypothetical protein